MRLHRLELTAFGPFAAPQSVDFDELSAAGLFLLHGPTGAGKTSVLDAVCFALYGQVPGARPATRLRSDHAAPGTPTEVVLELTLGGRRLEITRRPEQPRAKKRGTGTTMDKAVTLLREQIGGQWRGVSKSHQEIGEEIRQLVGMSCEQFCQVVLLPQGEFATFLRASATERAALLGRLFDTRRFKSVEHWLRDRRQESAQLLAQGDAELAQLAARMRQAAGPGPDGDPGDGADVLEWAAVLRSTARERYGIARAAVRHAEGAYAVAAERAEQARALHTLQARHAAALARAAALALEAPARAAARTALSRARRAVTVEPALALRDKAASRHDQALRVEQDATASLRRAGEPPWTPSLPPARTPGHTLPPPNTTPGHADSPGPTEADRTPGVVNDPAGGAGSGSVARLDAPRQWGSGAGSLEDERPAGVVNGLAGGSDSGVGAVLPRPAAGWPGAAGSGGVNDGAGGVGSGAGPSGERRGRAGGDSRAVEVGAASEGRQRGADISPAGSGTRVAGGPGLADGVPGGPGDAAGTKGEGCAANTLVAGTRPAVNGPRPAGGGEPSGAVGGPGAGEPADGVGAVLTRRAGEAREELGGLAAAAALEARTREIAERRATLDREERTDEEALRDAQAWLEEWPAARAALQARLDAGLDAADRAAALAADVEAARRRSAAAAERDALAAESTRHEDNTRDARDRTAAARETWQDLREARITGIAAELAARLVDGEPCRVCGAPEHPAPAHPAAQQVTRADEDTAYADFQRESARYERARDEVARLRAALAAATATAGDAPRDRLAAAHAESAARHTAAVRAAADVAEARHALTRAEEERDRRAAQRQDALSRTAARNSRREELDTQYEQLTAEVARARAGHAGVAARRDHLTARIALLDRAVHAVRDRTGAAERLHAAEAALAEAAARAGFGSPAEAAAALLPPARLAEAEFRAEARAKEEAAVEADATAPETLAAAALPPADPAAATAVLDAANRLLRAASAAGSAAATACAELDRLGALATGRARELGPARAEFDRIKRLADLTSANTTENQYRMELETYVLAARLEQVAAAAGVRLQRMSGGRYTLVHTDARGGGRAKSGLGLMVVDAWTGTERDTSTLSGGETFFASLALALGLADVVTDESGGTRLDTLFIDEGFGSLDDQTLDEVLDVLDGLRERDRAVGIVSHVADLRHRIPAQLRVVKGRDGSTVRLGTGAVRG